MSLIIEPCDICKSPHVHRINEDLILRFSHSAICQRNGLEYNKTTVKALIKHHKDHIESTALALSRQMLQQEAIELKNGVIEVNSLLDQNDLFTIKAYERLATAKDNTEWVKIMKSITDLENVKIKAVQLHNKVSGADLQEEMQRASLTKIIGTISKKIGQQKLEEIQKNKRKNDNIMSNLDDDPFIKELLDQIDGDDEDYTVKDQE